MNIFGIGTMELIFILIIMLVVAGPKRMIRWAYILGQYTAKLRRLWEETVDYVQKEFDEAGVDIQVPREPPTRASLNRQITNAMKPITEPVKEALDEVGSVKKSALSAAALKPEEKPADHPPESETAPARDFGTWSGSDERKNGEGAS